MGIIAQKLCALLIFEVFNVHMKNQTPPEVKAKARCRMVPLADLIKSKIPSLSKYNVGKYYFNNHHGLSNLKIPQDGRSHPAIWYPNFSRCGKA
ncbi:MAG: hypothetical protein A2698_01765 [Candidatus Levybacteria bacterium RIFCSPHIGHO2_01_FULL_42_15]|nr:MAG: hypothetical protein A2698_01765 [Candidatus Levybacteria bacterium RIFCSPHIGHO2_01_FULL_42_15]